VDPPQGPFNNCLEHREIGQIPPVNPKTHSPHPWHLSAQTPGRSEAPMNVVFTAGKTGFVLNRLAIS
jgi:hypothetical protein